MKAELNLQQSFNYLPFDSLLYAELMNQKPSWGNKSKLKKFLITSHIYNMIRL